MNKATPHFTIDDRFLDQPYTLAGRLIDPVSGMLSWKGKREHLRRKELEVLALLASAEGKQVTRENFIAVVWQGNDLVGDRGLSNTIVFVRKSLRDDDGAHPVIRTIPRRGYQLAVPVQLPPEAAVVPVSPVQVEAVFVPGGMIPECPGWRLVKRLSQSAVIDSWLAEPSEFGERDQSLRVFRFCRSEAHLQRLRREVTLLRYLRDALSDNQHFALIQDWQLDEPPYFLARDYTAFGALSQWGGLTDAPLAQRMAMMQDLSEAVAAMHAIGVVHRQLSVDTVLVDASESGPSLKISTFDLAALNDRSKLEPLKITAAGLTVGVEDAAVALTAADDLYALGVVLLQLALGDLLAQPNAEGLSKIPNSTLQTLLSACLGPASTRPSATELATQLRRISAPKSGAPKASVLDIEVQPAQLAIAPFALNIPETIGNYRLLDCLGEGGMGTVYLAEQREPYRQVALKVIRSGLDGKQILSRFEAERQALALMNHPNVTTVLDSGLAADGRPFFAMEYVRGDEITHYCDTHCLNIPARISLFLQVCDGVLHAHQKGVLHRDIKPSNIMVSAAAESTGTVKIIDFGLAKSLHGKLAAHTLHTSFGAFIGTPVYSSPEHVSGAASGVDTRSDIYSMGVVLYELLAGVTPIASALLENLEPEKLRELVCKSKLPSMEEKLLNTSAEKRAEIADHRAIPLVDLPKTLGGDLSWVVGKCLEKDPNDRYASVLALKEDLQRWLELRPVEARPTSRWYRFTKLVKRNRAASALISASVAALLLTTTAAVVGFLKADQSAKVAQDLAAQSEVANKFLESRWQSISPEQLGLRMRADVLAALDQAIADGEPDAERLKSEHNRLLQSVNFTDISIGQLRYGYFKPALEDIANQYRAQPLLQARLYHSIAGSLLKLRILDLALETQIQVVNTRSAHLGARDPLTLEAVQQRGDVFGALGEFPLAAKDYQIAFGGFMDSLGPDHPSTVIAEYLAISAVAKLLRVDQLKRLKQLLSKRLASHSAEDYWALRMRILIANLQRIAEPNESISNLNLVLKYATDKSPEIQSLRAQALSELSAQNLELGDAESALTLAEQGLEIRKIVHGDAGVATQVDGVNLALIRLGRAEEAEKLKRETLAKWRDLYGMDNAWSLYLQIGLAETIAEQGRLSEAVELARATVARYATKQIEGTRAFRIFGEILALKGDLGEAELALNEAKHLAEQLQSGTSRINSELALVMFRKGDKSTAANMLRDVFEKTSLLKLQAAGRLGLVLANLGQFDEAKAMLNAAVANPRPWERAISLQYLADLHRDLGELDQALKANLEAVALGRKSMHPHYPVLAELLNSLALTQSALGQHQTAQKSMQEALAIIAQNQLHSTPSGVAVKNGCLKVQGKFPTGLNLECI